MHSRRNLTYGSEDVNKATVFPLLADFLIVNNISTHGIEGSVVNHLQQLSQYFHKYFGNVDVCAFDWIRNPVEFQLTDLTRQEQLQSAEFSFDRSLRSMFTEMPLRSF
ncbi:hypothetical protein RF11_06446 [Thelohanellus kitauei]|uniref:Uncharacterized protein n=1 Tax=Thelohanellus kitauei TaxID=669202 RepID=A0A0C2J483_THEKT|nr:hypothetical protein RF11_06446 [Thelohanellus kitauei]